jgi:hypothetical protein
VLLERRKLLFRLPFNPKQNRPEPVEGRGGLKKIDFKRNYPAFSRVAAFKVDVCIIIFGTFPPIPLQQRYDLPCREEDFSEPRFSHIALHMISII